MKTKFVFAVLLMAFAFVADAQFRKIPAEVTDSFKIKYPTATRVSWSDKIGSFQAEFKDGEQKIKANFSSKGEWLKEEKKYDYEKLPGQVKDGFTKSKYADWNIKEVVETYDKEEGHGYRVTVRKGDLAKRYLRFAESGQLLNDSMTF